MFSWSSEMRAATHLIEERNILSGQVLIVMNDEAGMQGSKKVSLAAIMEQKKVPRAVAEALQQTEAAAEPSRPKRKLPTAMLSGIARTSSGASLLEQQQTATEHITQQQEPLPAMTATPQQVIVPDSEEQQQNIQRHKPARQPSARSQQAVNAETLIDPLLPKQKQSLSARLQQLNHAPAAAVASNTVTTQQQQGKKPPDLLALAQPNWDRRSRALRALDALAGKSQGLPQPAASDQGLGPASGSSRGLNPRAGGASGNVWGGSGASALATGLSGAGSRVVPAPAAGGLAAGGAGRSGAASTAGAASSKAETTDQQWDKALADRAADMLWNDDEHHQQQQQQQRRKKRSRQQEPADATDPGTGTAAVSGSAAAAAGSSKGSKRQRSGPPAAAVVVRSVRDELRDALLAEDAALPLDPAVGGVLGGAGVVPGLGLGATDDEQGPPAEPLELIDTKTGLHLQVPGSINKHLRFYQREGVQFLFNMYCKGRGGVLSDDMGLGKTVQAISFLAALLGKTGTLADALPRTFATHAKHHQQQQAAANQQQPAAQQEAALDPARGIANSTAAAAGGAAVRWPVLVVAPTSVLDNWVREFNMWGHFKVVKYSTANASHIQEQAAMGTLEVILTSYDQLRINTEDILGIDPHVVIFDEVHRLKNSKSRVYEAVKRGLKTKYRYGLSGTIMPNNHEELWAVLDILVPGCLGDYKEYSDYYGKPIRKGQSRTAKQWEIRKGAERLSQLQELLQKVYLRRTKAIIADQLPKKKDNIVFCQLKPLQYRAYDRTLASPDLQVLQRSRELCDCGSGLMRGQCCYDTVPPEAGGVMWPHYHLCSCHDPECKRHRPEGCAEYYRQQGRENVRIVCPNCLMLPAISLLQKISNHLDLIRPDAKLAETDEQQFKYQLKLAQMVLGNDASALGGLVANSGGWLGASDETHCGKMATLQALLTKWSCERNQHNKVLLFSHSTRVLDLLEKFVQRAGYDYVRLDGSTAQKQRQALVDEFNTRPSIFLFLMSTLAGGVGLNLTAANKVVVFDPSWNPSNDLQAQDRAYRLGQTRDVEVYRLVGTGTLEELVYRRQIYKQQQSNMVLENKQEARYFEGVQGDKDKQGELWGLQNLLRFSGHTIETRDILNAYQEGSSERQRLERQLQQQQQRVQQKQGAGADTPAATTAAVDGDAAKPTAVGDSVAAGSAQTAAGPRKVSSIGFEIVEVDNLAGVEQDQAADPANPAAAAGAPTLITDVLDIDKLQQEAPEFLEGDDAAAAAAVGVGGITPQKPRKPRQQQQQSGRRAGRLGTRAVKQQEDDLEEYASDHGLEDSDMEQQQQQQQQHRGHQHQQVLQDAESSGSGDFEDLAAADDGADSLGLNTDHNAVLQPAAAAAGVGAATQVMDSLVAALQHEGVILHMHTHDSILGKGEKVPRRKQQLLSNDDQQQQPTVTRRSKLALSAAAEGAELAANSASTADGLDPRQAAAVRASAAVLSAARAAAEEGDSMLASLAVWQGMQVTEVARMLLQLNVQERRELMLMYAADMTAAEG